jgi:SAM-dependent methyltransferase
MVEKVKRVRANGPPRAGAAASAYDLIAGLYDAWSRGVTEDVDFYVEEAARVEGPIVELGVGTGRIAVPVAASGRRVIGIDSSKGMLEVCRRAAEREGLSERIDLRLGDLRDPPLTGRFPLILCPFRAYLHLHDEPARLSALRAARRLLEPGGRLIFDVFAPGADDIADTHGRWLEREPGIWERANWDTANRRLELSVRDAARGSTMSLAWISPLEWRRLLDHAGFTVEACYGWFDRSPYRGGEDTVWIARR